MQQQTDRSRARHLREAGEKRDRPVMEMEYRAGLALGATAAVVVFVGTFVVLSIPFALFSIPLPSSVDRLGLIETTQSVLFGHPWHILVPAMLAALGMGYGAYRWYRRTATLSS